MHKTSGVRDPAAAFPLRPDVLARLDVFIGGWWRCR
jgi:hypothetical protein